MNKLEILKTVSGITIGLGVDSIVTNQVMAHTPKGGNKLNCLCTAAAMVAIVGLVSKHAITYANRFYDDLFLDKKDKVDEEEKEETV